MIRNGHDARNNSRSVPSFAVHLLSFASLAASVGLVPQSAFAQTVDYSALEQLFGQAVTTSATGSPEHESDVSVNMQIVTADEIRRSGAQDIPGILKHVLGVDVM